MDWRTDALAAYGHLAMTYVDWPSANGAGNQNVKRRHTCVFIDPKSSPGPLRGQESITLSHTNHSFTRLQPKSFENIVGKGEIACYEQFLLFRQCFPIFQRALCHF